MFAGNHTGTFSGDSFGLHTGAVVGNLTGDIFSTDDSTRILNSVLTELMLHL